MPQPLLLLVCFSSLAFGEDQMLALLIQHLRWGSTSAARYTWFSGHLRAAPGIWHLGSEPQQKPPFIPSCIPRASRLSTSKQPWLWGPAETKEPQIGEQV
jgi:hypothetical protein